MRKPELPLTRHRKGLDEERTSGKVQGLVLLVPSAEDRGVAISPIGNNMNALTVNLILTLTVALTHYPQVSADGEPVVIAGKGWGKICLGAPRELVSREIGEEGIARSKYDDVYFVDYPSKGLQISFTTSENKAANIYFYNKQRRYESFATARVKTDKGIDWNSTPDQLIAAYGKPKEDYYSDGISWRRMVYDGIDFRFENGTLVRIGIPGK